VISLLKMFDLVLINMLNSFVPDVYRMELK